MLRYQNPTYRRSEISSSQGQLNQVQSSAVIVKADRGLFARMVVIAHHRQRLGPLPWSLATADGAPTKTAKSALLHILEGKAQPVEDVPASAVWILDGVAILHSMKDVPRTFSSLAS